ncbi:hypothetical protein HN784_00890 [bacterium]|jgi:hypothetical protein|nr:hypothetical protein [bacterium]MBT4251632.1 hypothetical protein [bacterium]MBT4597681.1 hypothetical protein [bacterium]MBT6753694.1 hypothetical protein [bacterium]MBT7037831.1 hypothetical protein [bacterium]
MKKEAELLEIINNSTLTKEQKNIWGNAVSEVDDETATLLIEAIGADEKALEVLTFNLEGKYEELSE